MRGNVIWLIRPSYAVSEFNLVSHRRQASITGPQAAGIAKCSSGQQVSIDVSDTAPHQAVLVDKVQIEYLTEARIGFELMLAVIGFEREPVRPKAIVIDVLEVEFSLVWIINHHAALLKQLDLLGISSR